MQFVNPVNLDAPFGGKVMVLAGDVKKTLLIVPRRSIKDIIFYAINIFVLVGFLSCDQASKQICV